MNLETLPNSREQVALLVSSPEFPEVERKLTVAKTPNGEVRLEQGADGLYILFDGPCLEMLPFCQAQCCALKGTGVRPEEEEALDPYIEWDEVHGMPIMKRDADGFCTCLDRKTRTCQVYENRPETCKVFHCTRGGVMRGFKLPNGIRRQSID